MKIGIICASDSELAPFLPHLNVHTTETHALIGFHCGRFKNAKLVALYSGVCKVNAALASQTLINLYGVDAIINAGTAGAIDTRLNLFDTVISTQAAYHDVSDEILTEFHPFMPTVYFYSDERLLTAAKKIFSKKNNVFFGKSVTGESFISNEGRERIISKFNPLSVDMETAAIAHVCFANGVPFIAIRSITDTPEKSGINQFEKTAKRRLQLLKI